MNQKAGEVEDNLTVGDSTTCPYLFFFFFFPGLGGFWVGLFFWLFKGKLFF